MPDESPSDRPDPRWRAAALADGTNYGFVIEPVRFDDGQVVHLPHPLAGRFKLLTALEFLRRAEAARVEALRDPLVVEDGGLRLREPERLFDAYGDLIAGVLVAYAGIEAYANEAIERLDGEFVLRIERDGEERAISKDDLARRLSLAEKLDRIVPIVASRRSIKGLAVWEEFRRLRSLRDALVHLKRRGYSTNPDQPSEFGRLARGEAATAVRIAARVIEAAEPGWLPAEVHAELIQPIS
jgi:hypothetical protein